MALGPAWREGTGDETSQQTTRRPAGGGRTDHGKRVHRGADGKAFGAYVGREVRRACSIIRRMIEEDHTIVLAFSGAMTRPNFGASCMSVHQGRLRRHHHHDRREPLPRHPAPESDDWFKCLRIKGI